MQFDWNHDEINALKQRATVHSEVKAVSKHLENLELHLKTHQNTRSFELRKKVWETVEEWATKLDKLLNTLIKD